VECVECDANQTSGFCDGGPAQFSDPSSYGCSTQGWGSSIVRTDNGQVLTTCLNPYSSKDQTMQQDLGFAFALSVTLVFMLTIILGFGFLLWVRAMFARMEQFASAHQEEEAQREKQQAEGNLQQTEMLKLVRKQRCGSKNENSSSVVHAAPSGT